MSVSCACLHMTVCPCQVCTRIWNVYELALACNSEMPFYYTCSTPSRSRLNLETDSILGEWLACRPNKEVFHCLLKRMSLLSAVTQWCHHCHFAPAVKSLEVHNRSKLVFVLLDFSPCSRPFKTELFASKASTLKPASLCLSLRHGYFAFKDWLEKQGGLHPPPVLIQVFTANSDEYLVLRRVWRESHGFAALLWGFLGVGVMWFCK